MVDVRRRSQEQIRSWADRQIQRLIAYWQELTEVAAEIDRWDVGEAQAYVEEWPLYEMFRRELEQVAQQGMLTSEQEVQLDELRRLVAQYGPLLNQLLGHRPAE
jgi:hypothetical protein